MRTETTNLREGQNSRAVLGPISPADPQAHTDGEGPLHFANGLSQDAAAVRSELREGLSNGANIGPVSVADPQAIALIREVYRLYRYAQEQRKRADLSLGSFLRTALGWKKSLPEVERKQISKLAADLIKCGENEFAQKKKPHALRKDASYLAFKDTAILPSLVSREIWKKMEENSAKRLEQLAEALPIWQFCNPIRGFGAGSLAAIVAEAGDLSLYANHSKLWKRMGLAVIDGVRQGGLRKSAKADEWVRHGYNRQRRSVMWNIGDCLVKLNQSGRYRTCYLARKDYLRQRAEALGFKVVPAAKIPKAKAELFVSDGHIHRSAQRYMEKRLLRDLWQAWGR